MADEEEDTCTMYSFTQDDIDAVNVINWHQTFKEICPRTELIQIPPEVLKYLKSDKLVMPKNTHTSASLSYRKSKGKSALKEEEEDDDDESWASLSDTEEAPPVPPEFLQELRQQQPKKGGVVDGNGDEVWESAPDSSEDTDDEVEPSRKVNTDFDKFQEFDALLKTSIKELDGAVLPKVGRKSPKDATWVAFNRSLKCYNPGDIYLLLKTSDMIPQILENPYRSCPVQENHNDASNGATALSPFYLALKEWKDSWGPEMEFRCFICANQITAICQRDVDTCYSSIVKRKEKLLINIQNFFLKYIRDQFPLDYYILDIVCHPSGEIYVVDFDVFGLGTDPLLFTYHELKSIYEEMTRNAKNSSGGDADSNNVSGSSQSLGQPCLRFLTESRNFRGHKTTEQPTLASDVMTYMRHCANNQ